MNDDKSIKIDIPKLVREQPGNAAIFSKINTDKNMKFDKTKVLSNIPTISQDIRTRLEDNEDILKLFPDTELAMQILTSSVISPNDMITTSLIYKSPDIKLPLDVKQTILDTIERHISTEYNLESRLSDILRESLFIKGAYVEAIIPEASLDSIINNSGDVSLEHHNLENDINHLIKHSDKGLGILSLVKNKDLTNVNLSSENYIELPNKQSSLVKINYSLEDLGLDITDNVSILGRKRLYENNIHNVVNRKIYGANEDTVYKFSSEAMEISLDDLFRPTQTNKDMEILHVPTDDINERKSIGKPLVMKLPVESTIPVHVKSNPKKHLGYYILLDESGIPMNIPNETNRSNSSSNGTFNVSMDSKINLINKAKTALTGITKDAAVMENLDAIYNDIVDKTLRDRLKNGMYGDLADFKENTDLYRVMLTRALANKKTRVLYMPKELVAFYAFDFRENGTGKSLIEKANMLYSIRSILLFAKIMATVKNSTSTTKISAKLDDDDQDPEGTMEHIISESLKTRQTQVPIGIMKIDDLVDWTQRAGFLYNFQHPSLPDMTIDVQQEMTQYQVPDQDLDETIQNHIIMSFGLTPEIIQAGYSSDFATTVMAKNLLFAKRVYQTQALFTPMISDNIRKYIKNDMLLIEKLRSVLEANITVITSELKKQLNDKSENEIEKDIIKNKAVLINYIINVYIREVTVEFPVAELSEAEPMKNALAAYKEVIDTYIDVVFSSEALPAEMFGDLSGKLDTVKSIIKAILYKKWMTDNNYIPEIAEFLSIDEEGKPIFNILDEYKVYSSNLADALLPFLKDINRFVESTNKKLGKIDTSASDSYAESEDNPDDNSDYSEDGSDDTTEEDNSSSDLETTDDNSEDEDMAKEESNKEDKPEDTDNSKEEDSGEDDFKMPKF